MYFFILSQGKVKQLEENENQMKLLHKLNIKWKPAQANIFANDSSFYSWIYFWVDVANVCRQKYCETNAWNCVEMERVKVPLYSKC